MPNKELQWPWGIAFLLLLMIRASNAEENHISIIEYNQNDQLLSLNVVISGGGLPQIYLQSDGMLSELTRFTQIGDHQLSVYLPCDEFEPTDSLYYKVGKETLALSLDKVSCVKALGSMKEPKIIYTNNQCVIEPNGRTLWRIGLLLERKNGFSVYQNIYALFLTNRGNFIDDDIFKLQAGLLVCPPEELIASIEKNHASEMYREADSFRLAQRASRAEQDDPRDRETLIASVPTATAGAKGKKNAKSLPQSEPLPRKGTTTDAVIPQTHIADTGRGPANDASATVAASRKVGRNSPHELGLETAQQMTVEDPLTVNATADNKVAMNTANTSSEYKPGKLVKGMNAKGEAAVKRDAAGRASIYYIEQQCYIDPQRKTLWRVGLTLSEVNQYSIEQNMYAVYLANPLAFPKKDPRHMLDIRLSCPDVKTIGQFSTQEARRKLSNVSH